MIIITGASRGIGKYLFDYYYNNEDVLGTYNTTNIDNPEKKSEYYQVDVSEYDSVMTFYNSIETRVKNITLINCAGISYSLFAHKSDPYLWKKVIEVNLIGTYHVIRAFLPKMRDQNFGRIINFSSVVAQKGSPGLSAYASSKSALWGLSKSLAQENGSKGITINNINLGYVNLGMGIEQVSNKYQDIVKEQVPSKKFCEPDEILKTVEYLRNTSYLNGISIDLSGGLV